VSNLPQLDAGNAISESFYFKRELKSYCGPSKYLAGFLYKEQFRNHTCSYPVKKVSLV
jgi:hypothetical protein